MSTIKTLESGWGSHTPRVIIEKGSYTERRLPWWKRVVNFLFKRKPVPLIYFRGYNYHRFRALKRLQGKEFVDFLKSQWPDDYTDWFYDLCVDTNNEHFAYEPGDTFYMLPSFGKVFVEFEWAAYDSAIR